ncbi:MAG: RidA family protein [Dehalococcoidia bacterium]|nr:RidA family protein [Dehalococcoidia bacterium]
MADARTITRLAFPEGWLPLGLDPEPMAVQLGDLLFTNGIPGIDPATGVLPASAEAQFALAYKNLERLLDSAGVGTAGVGLLTVFIPGPDYRQYINPGWLALFPNEADRPARKTNHVNLPDGVYVQLQGTAVVGAHRRLVGIPGLSHRDPLPMGCRVGDLFFTSVMTPQDPATGQNADGPVPQIERCFENVAQIMQQAGGSLDDALHLWVFMSDFTYQPEMVTEWIRRWPRDGDRPARKTLRYALGGDSLLQAQVTAVLGGVRTNYELPHGGHHDPIPLASKVGRVLMSSGISGTGPNQGGREVPGLAPQIELCQQDIAALMQTAGGSLDNVALVTVLVQDWASVPVVLQHWDQLYPNRDNRPALKFIDWRMPQGMSLVQYHLTAVM